MRALPAFLKVSCCVLQHDSLLPGSVSRHTHRKTDGEGWAGKEEERKEEEEGEEEKSLEEDNQEGSLDKGVVHISLAT